MQHAQFASIWFVYWQHSGQYSLARLMLRVATRRYASCATPQPPLSCPALPHLSLSYTIPISIGIRIRIRFRISISISIGIGHCTWPKERVQHEAGAEGGPAAAKRSEAKQTKTKPNPTEVRWERKIELKRWRQCSFIAAAWMAGDIWTRNNNKQTSRQTDEQTKRNRQRDSWRDWETHTETKRSAMATWFDLKGWRHYDTCETAKRML